MSQANQVPLVFQGELEVEDGGFTCIVERFIISGNRASIQMRCRDDGGPHTAEGSFDLENGTWRTLAFSVLYPKDPVPARAVFKLLDLDVSPDQTSATLSAEWSQAGEHYGLEGVLDRA